MDPFYKATIQKCLPQWRGGAMFGQYNLRAAYSTMADILYESSDLLQCSLTLRMYEWLFEMYD